MKKLSFLLIFLAGVLWGSIGLFVRSYNEAGLAAMDIVAIRAAATTAAMFVFLLIYNPKLFKIKIKDLWCFLGTGILSIVFFNFCYFKAISFTSMAVASVLLYTAPAMVMVMSRFLFQEKLGTVKLASLLATFLGCVLVTGLAGKGTALNPAGILIGLGAGFGYALYSIFTRYALERGYHTFTITFYTFLLAMAGAFPLADKGRLAETAAKDAASAGFALLFGLVTTVFPYVLYTIGLTYIENGKAAIIASVEPVVATLTGILFFGESLTAQNTLGIFLILGAIAACNLSPVSAKKGVL